MTQPRFIMRYSFGKWIATHSNTDIVYYFTDRDAAIRLAQRMRISRVAAINEIDNPNDPVFDLRGNTAQECYDQLFTATRSGFYDDSLVAFWDGVGATVDQALNAFGAAFEAVLLAAASAGEKGAKPGLHSNGTLKDQLPDAVPVPAPENSLKAFLSGLKPLENTTGALDSLNSPQSGVFYITVSNYATKPWTLGTYAEPPRQNGTVTINQSMHSPMVANNGSETMAWTEVFPNVAEGPYVAYCVWQSNRDDGIVVQLGFAIQVPYQQYHIGYSPYYQVYYQSNVNVNSNGWLTQDASSAYIFPAELGYKVRVSANHSGTAQTLDITIEDPASLQRSYVLAKAERQN